MKSIRTTAGGTTERIKRRTKPPFIFPDANKKIFYFFQKGIDKLPELWYNRYRKREGKADPNKNEREIKNYDKDHLQSIPFERYKLD